MNFPLVPLAILGLAAGSFALVPEPVSAPSSAEDTVRYVNVTSSGTVQVQPSYLSIRATVSSNAEVGEEAVMDFAQARTRALGGLMGTELPGAEVLGSGVEFAYTAPVKEDNNNYFISSSNMEEPEEGVTCKEKLEFRFMPEGDVETQRSQIALGIDVAIELGLKLEGNVSNPYYNYQNSQNNGTHTVRGMLTEEGKQAAFAQAQEAAMEAAHREAAQLAGISGAELGAVLFVSQANRKLEWKGLGEGLEVSCILNVRFEMK